MAKVRPNKKKPQKSDKLSLNRFVAPPTKAAPPPKTSSLLLAQATAALHQGDIHDSVQLAKQALDLTDTNSKESLPVLTLLGEIHVELGEVDVAREYFLAAAAIHENGGTDEKAGGGVDKFLWLAQLSENGGKDSVKWFEKGAGTLRVQIQALLEQCGLKTGKSVATEEMLEEKRRKLATALCGIVEVYMTDLSWEEDAEQRCEALVTEATMVAPACAEPWQTLASVRISQSRIEDARAALKRSLDLWKDLLPEDESVPDFPTRVSLVRLLMEAEMEEDAFDVLERLVNEDDSSVEVWYLGGWCLYIIGGKQKSVVNQREPTGEVETFKVSWISSRQWLKRSMQLFELQDYEDFRLGEHTRELIAILDEHLGGSAVGADEDNDGWESDDEDTNEDEKMVEV